MTTSGVFFSVFCELRHVSDPSSYAAFIYFAFQMFSPYDECHSCLLYPCLEIFFGVPSFANCTAEACERSPFIMIGFLFFVLAFIMFVLLLLTLKPNCVDAVFDRSVLLAPLGDYVTGERGHPRGQCPRTGSNVSIGYNLLWFLLSFS